MARQGNISPLPANCFLRRVRILQPSTVEHFIIITTGTVPILLPVHDVTRTSTRCYVGVSLCVKIFNVYGTRPYVMFLTSRTSSYVLFLLAAFLPFHLSRYLRSRNFTLQLPLVHRTFNSLVIFGDSYVVFDRDKIYITISVLGCSLAEQRSDGVLQTAKFALLPNVLSGRCSVQLLVIMISPSMDCYNTAFAGIIYRADSFHCR